MEDEVGISCPRSTIDHFANVSCPIGGHVELEPWRRELGCGCLARRHEAELQAVRRVGQGGERMGDLTDLPVRELPLAQRQDVEVAPFPAEAAERGRAVEIDAHEIVAERAQQRTANRPCRLMRVA